MKIFTYLCLFLLLLVMSGSLAAAGKDRHHERLGALEIEGIAEPILGLIYAAEGLEFQVRSTGCTEKDHFVVQRLNQEGQMSSQLLLIRVVPDYCDAYVPFGTRLFYRYAELGLEEDERFTLLNPLSDYRVPYD